MKRPLIPALRVFIALTVVGLATVALVRHFHIRHFSEVREGALYRSGQPEGLDWARLNYRYHIHTVVNLRSRDERREGDWYEAEHQAADKYEQRLVELPMDDPVPTGEQADSWLRIAADPANWPILVHCERGKDRTGTLIALYRMYLQGWTLKQAMDELVNVKGSRPGSDVEAFLASYRPHATFSRAGTPLLEGSNQ